MEYRNSCDKDFVSPISFLGEKMDKLTTVMLEKLKDKTGTSKNEILESLVMTIADSSCGAVDSAGLTGAVPSALILNTISSIRTLIDSHSEDGDFIVNNPLILDLNPTWTADAKSLKTLAYLRQRNKLNLASSGTATAGGAASVVTAVDVVSVGQNGNAVGSTAAHVVNLKKISEQYKNDKVIKAWLDLIIACKVQKGAIRTAQGVIGLTAFGVGAIVCGVVGTAVKAGITLKFSTVCKKLALELHFRAYQESRTAASKSKPATEILNELFARRGFTRIFGQHDISGMIQEPGGWMAIADKLLLI